MTGDNKGGNISGFLPFRCCVLSSGSRQRSILLGINKFTLAELQNLNGVTKRMPRGRAGGTIPHVLR